MDSTRGFVAVRSAEGFLYGLIFAATMVYMIDLGLTALELVLVGTAVEASVLLFEVPTGVVADRRSRRLSVAIGYAITGGAYVLMGSVPCVAAVIAASALWGIGHTFGSGAFVAWMVDEIGQRRAEPLLARTARFSALAGVVGTLLGVWLGARSLAAPLVAGGVGFVVLAIVARAGLPETTFTPAASASPNPLRAIAETAGAGIRAIRGSTVLVALVVITVAMGAYSEGFDRLRDAHLIRNIGLPVRLEPIVWIGFINVTISLVGFLTTTVLERRILSIRRPGIPLAAGTIAVGALIVTLALTRSVLVAVAAALLAGVVRQTSAPLQDAWINRHVPSRVRATVLSFYGQADSMGQVGFGPLVGAIGSVAGIPVALVVSAGVLVPACVLYLATTTRRDGSRRGRSTSR